MVNLYSLIMNVLLGHCDNFLFFYFFLNFAFLDHSANVQLLCMNSSRICTVETDVHLWNRNGSELMQDFTLDHMIFK